MIRRREQEFLAVLSRLVTAFLLVLATGCSGLETLTEDKLIEVEEL